MTVRGVDLEIRDSVAWILINDYQATTEAGASDQDYIGVHDGIGIALDECRWDTRVRLVVLTGRHDGEFYRFSRRSHWDSEHRGRLNPLLKSDPAGGSPGVRRRPDAHEQLLVIEKPVIARINGDAMGFGSSLIWGCDITVARDDARIAWGHTGMGRLVDSNGETRGFPWAMTPSYGMASLLYMPPSKAKEFMMLSKVYSGRELADMNAINYAVPAADLDRVTDDLIAQLLERPDTVLTRVKQLCNKRLEAVYHEAEQLSRAFAALDIYEQAAKGMMG